MAYVGQNYMLVKHSPENENIIMTINWRGREVNMDRRKNETIDTTITRLKRSLQKLDNVQHKQSYNLMEQAQFYGGGPQPQWGPYQGGYMDPAHLPNHLVASGGTSTGLGIDQLDKSMPDKYTISFMTSSFQPFDGETLLQDVAKNASFLSINDTLLQIYINVYRIFDVKVSSKAMVGCPVTVSIQSDGPLGYADVMVDWWNELGQLLHRGPIYVPHEEMVYNVVKVTVSHKKLKWNVIESDYCQILDAPNNRWQYERIMLFNAAPVSSTTSPLQSDIRDLRVMSFNILSPTYVATEEAIQRFFPYCPHEWLDSSYRNPLILREILMLKPQVLCLQECATSAYRDHIEPVLGQHYYSWLTIKSTTSDEGCCLFIKKDVFDVVDVQSLMFKEQILKQEYSDVLDRIGANSWLNYNEQTYFSKYHTVFQMSCLRNKLDEKKNYLFLANTHLYFHPNGRHIRLLQTYVFLNELEHFKKRCAEQYGFDLETESSTIICGDFNSFSSEGAVHLMVNGWVPYNHEDFDFGLLYGHERFIPGEQSGQYLATRRSGVTYYPLDSCERLEVQNCQGYQDAYSGQELPFTNFVKTFHGTLDYIFHSKNLTVKRCMPGITKREAQEYEGLPSKIYPSDHISIAVDF
ncbi:endonuclease exonuclease phosphatase family protein [Babesia ovis]|uniref:Endonuclease exonuclease phosphatase family protein n=1 Tax=Babesia ovis TaxID=5869 RepID=A0A9W5TAZ9_BABOV|nr:endonuclease exonuclease phosphatase family protein [Babesia ovis]